jgi:predicted nucleic acid-binding Zn ribbon protein
MVNDRELLGSLEITALLSGLRQPEPLGRLKMNIYSVLGGGSKVKDTRRKISKNWDVCPICGRALVFTMDYSQSACVDPECRYNNELEFNSTLNQEKKIRIATVDRCVMCGNPVPEGQQVCGKCKHEEEDG